jgi:hypothetical protein
LGGFICFAEQKSLHFSIVFLSQSFKQLWMFLIIAISICSEKAAER